MLGLANRGGHRRTRGSGVDTSAPRWMVTYSDLVTQLLAFFVILFAISSIDVQRFQALMSAFRGSLGVLDGGRTFDDTRALGNLSMQIIPSISRPQAIQQLQQVYEDLTATLARETPGEAVQLIPQERGLVVRFSDRVLFDLGKADLRPEARKVLDAVANVLAGLPNRLRVEGHTDNLPIHNARFPSNWELSTARATTVVRYLVERHRLAPARLSAAGFGEYWPLAPNRTEAGRARNRRVDIVILRLDLMEEQAQPAGSPATPASTDGVR